MADTYSCKVLHRAVSQDAKVTIGSESIEIKGEKENFSLNFYEIKDFRLLNYHLHLILEGEEVEISMLGLNTEAFFDKLWDSYNKRSMAALFVKGSHIMDCEGDYAYAEGDMSRESKAKISLYDDCVCILPHDCGARRVPLCFMKDPIIEGFKVSMELDSGEIYSIARLGKETTPFYDRMLKLRSNAVHAWASRQKDLDTNLQSRLGERSVSLETFGETGARIISGLFSADPEDDTFWMAAIKNGKAAVELSIGESAATYLYTFDVPEQKFEFILRHAMEAVGKYREVIYLDAEDLDDKPLYLMSIERSSHVRALRKMNAGKAAHTANWEEKIREFL